MATSKLNSPTYYKAGDSYTIRAYIGGFITGSSKNIEFSVFLPKLCRGVQTIAINVLNIRSVDGRVDLTAADISSTTVSGIYENCLEIIVTVPNALAITTNTPVGMDVRGTVTFS